MVMGYFCVGANTRWGQTHPDLSYGAPSTYHIPFTTAYLDYLAPRSRTRSKDRHGRLHDRLGVEPKRPEGTWLDCEERGFLQELMD